MNRTLAEEVTSMLMESHLLASFWGEALSTFLYVRNRSPTSSLSSKHTLYELWHNKKLSISHSVKCIFLRYPDKYKS